MPGRRSVRGARHWLGELAWTRWMSLTAYGLVNSALFRPQTPPSALRRRFECIARVSRGRLARQHPGVQFEDHHLDGLHMESLRAAARPRCTILHLHGGGFLFGSPASYRRRALLFSRHLDAELFVPDYRLAPEQPFPAALEDALAAYRYVLESRSDAPLFVTGDSAGGGLALSLLVRLRDLGVPQPAGAILISPWADLALTAGSLRENRRRDVWLTPAHLTCWARCYALDSELRDPLVSPLFASLTGLSPLLTIVGEHELLRDDATRVAERVREAGGDARVVVGPAMQHDYPLSVPWLGASRAAWRAMAEFVAERCTAHVPMERLRESEQSPAASR